MKLTTSLLTLLAIATIAYACSNSSSNELKTNRTSKHTYKTDLKRGDATKISLSRQFKACKAHR
jgi:hypothetical protein